MPSMQKNFGRPSWAHRSGVRAGRGFSLIELMIVVAIIALLAAIAYPAYTSSVLKGKRAEGRTALLELMQQQERYFSQTGSYMRYATTDTSGTIYSGGAEVGSQAIPFKRTSGASPTNSAYQLSAAKCGSLNLNECVLLTATINGTADTEYGDLTLSSTGEKSCTTTNTANKAKCWSR